MEQWRFLFFLCPTRWRDARGLKQNIINTNPLKLAHFQGWWTRNVDLFTVDDFYHVYKRDYNAAV